MRRIVYGVGTLLAVAGLVALAVAIYLHRPASFEARLAKLERIAAAGAEAGRWPGVMWAVVQPGAVLATGAAGSANVEQAVAMTPETVMPIGSISKVLVGLAGAQASVEGSLDVEAPISEVLSIPFGPPDGAPRSFAQLAAHTAGIRDSDAGYEEVGYHYGSVVNPVPLATFLTRYLGADGDLYDPQANFGAEPGAVYEYSNVGAGLAAQVIEDATGVPFERYSTSVLAPLGLSGGWGPFVEITGPEATLYEISEEGGFEALPPYGLSTWPDGQYVASVDDLARLMAAILGGGMLDGAQVIDAAVVDALTRPRVRGAPGMVSEEDWIGLFWTRETLEFTPFRFAFEGHSGGDPGVLTFMYRVPETETAFVLMLNGFRGDLPDALELVRLARLLSDMPLPE